MPLSATHRATSLAAIALTAALALTACSSGTPSSDDTDATAITWPRGTVLIEAPGSVGGGFDSVGRALQSALADDPINANARVQNTEGAGGTIGLQSFVNDNEGDPLKLIVTGRTMLGSILTENTSVDLGDVTPIANVIGRYDAIAVAVDSPYETINDLVDAFVADPTSIVWGGGSIGGTDHLVVASIAQAVGVDLSELNYVAHSGGAEQAAALLAGTEQVSVSSLSEQLELVESGQLRFLAVTSGERIDGVDAPTLVESGIDVEIANWSTIAAASGITTEEKDAITESILAALDTDAWQEAVEANNWTVQVLTGQELDDFLESEKSALEESLTSLGLI